ncbi:MAG: UMP kinase, partial [Lachnospiraceae bacterium]|nr:UMP kinase [Lachnospiraceae bacterium]
KMPMAVFSLLEENGISNAMKGIINGTIVTV